VVDSTKKCPDEWDPSELLAYLEGDLPPDDRRELEQHLALCSACSNELESLRQLDRMLRACPQCFHPDEEDLYRFVSAAEDPEGRVSGHVETCEECQEAVAVLREMIAVGPQVSEPPQPMPRHLLQRLQAGDPAPGSQAERGNPFALALEWFRRPFGMPMLAVGTVAAALVVAVLLIPIWTGFKDVPKPEIGAPAEKAPLPAVEPNGRIAGGQPPVLEHGPKAVLAPAGEESPLPAPKLAPRPPAVSLPAPGAAAPTLEKAERPKLKEGLGEAPVSSRPRGASRSEKVTRWSSEPDSERRVGYRAQGGIRPTTPDRPSRALQKETDSQHRPRVTVRIVPPLGQELQVLRFIPLKEMESKYIFTEQPGTEEETVEKQEQAPRAAAIAPVEETYVVTVRISQSEAGYSLEGALSEPGATRDKRTLSKRNVSQENLQAEISAMVASLLQGG